MVLLQHLGPREIPNMQTEQEPSKQLKEKDILFLCLKGDKHYACAECVSVSTFVYMMLHIS